MLRAREGSAFPSAAIALDGWMENSSGQRTRDRGARIATARSSAVNARRAMPRPDARSTARISPIFRSSTRRKHAGARRFHRRAKALLIGLVLAHATLVAEMTGIAPLLLLDEVVAHLDPNRRKALFDELAKLGAQVWMTGADPAAFADIGASGEVFDVESGRISRAKLMHQAIAAGLQAQARPARGRSRRRSDIRAFFGRGAPDRSP